MSKTGLRKVCKRFDSTVTWAIDPVQIGISPGVVHIRTAADFHCEGSRYQPLHAVCGDYNDANHGEALWIVGWNANFECHKS
jgi:hypothetical protein